MGNKISKLDGMQERYTLIKLSFVAEQYYQQYTKERQRRMDMENDNTFKDLDKTRVKLFPNFTSIPFDYLLISWVTNYVSDLGFLTCLSWIVSIENFTLSNV